MRPFWFVSVGVRRQEYHRDVVQRPVIDRDSGFGVVGHPERHESTVGQFDERGRHLPGRVDVEVELALLARVNQKALEQKTSKAHGVPLSNE
jgi:hypothetical protein